MVNDIDRITILSNHWLTGVVMAGLASIFLIRHVKSQPTSRQNRGIKLILESSWAGLIYDLTDALFLNIMPVLAVWMYTSQLGWAETLWGKIFATILGLLASLLVALGYHLGYPEFRNKKIGRVLLGNSVITLTFLISGSPLGSILSHPAMHIAAVLHGPETTLQLPPHY